MKTYNFFGKTTRFVLLGALACLGLVTLFSSCDLLGLLKQGSTKKTAIIYGISIYGNVNDLVYPSVDAASMKLLLESQGWDTIYRIDSAATKAQLSTDVSNLEGTLEEGQRVMFYYSGHGGSFSASSGNPGEWIFPFGSVLVGGPVFPAAINVPQLAAIFKPLISKKANLVVVLDSCNSGGFTANGTYSSSLPDNYNEDPFAKDTPAMHPMFFSSISDYFNGQDQTGPLDQASVWVLSAAGKSELSWEASGYEHGIFTWAILDAAFKSGGFMHGDSNRDGFLTLSELFAYSTKRINDSWNSAGYSHTEDYQFLPHLSGNPLDILLFKN